MKNIKKALEGVMIAEIWLCGALVLIMVLLMCTEIVMRYIFNNSIIWVQEFAIGEFIWIVALCGNVALMLRSHITVKTFSQFLSEKGQQKFRLIATTFIFLALIYMLLNLPSSIAIQNKTRTSALPINIGKGLYYSAPLFLSSIIMMITQIYYFYYQIRELLGKPVAEDYPLVWRTKETS